MTRTRDAFGLPVTGAAPETLAALDTFARDWIGYGPDLAVLLPAAAQDPTCTLASAWAALLHMSLEAQEGYRAAEPFLARIAGATTPLTPREEAIVAAACAWGRHDHRASLAAFERAVAVAPADIVAAKWGQYLAFNLGEADAMLRLARAIMPAHAATPQAWGMKAFAEEQCHDLAGAEASARHALAGMPDEPWAQHALAHVFETQGRLDEGVAFLEAAAPAWSTRSIFIAEHNAWHLALFHLDRDDPPSALAIYDTQLWGRWPDFAQEQIGAVALLWRLELRGVDVGDRWQPVADRIRARGPEHLWPFHDMHYVHALARAGDGDARDAFLASLAAKAARDGGVWASVAYPLAMALVAAVRGDAEAAAGGIGACLPDLSRIGGSHAQRDIFVQAWINAAFAAGQGDRLRPVLEERARARPGVTVHARDLARLARRRS